MLVSSTKIAVCTKFLGELAKPERFFILEALREGPLLISGLVLVTSLDQFVVDSELDWLLANAFVTAKKRGRFVYYYLRDTRLSLLLHLADELSSNMDVLGEDDDPPLNNPKR